VWNSTEAGVYYINNENLRTFSFLISSLTSSTGNTLLGQGMAAAGSLLIFIPNLVIFIFSAVESHEYDGLLRTKMRLIKLR